MKKSIAFLAIAALFASSTALAGTVVATENFEADALGSVIGQTGGTGWASGWQSALSGAVGPKVVLENGDNALQLSTASTSAAYRELSGAISTDVFIRFEFSYSGTLGQNDFLGLWFGSSSGPNIGLKANCDTNGTTCIDDAFVRTGNNTTQMLSNSNLLADTTYVLFGHLYKTGTSTTYNRFDAWLNPSALEMSTLTNPSATSTGNSSLSSFTTLGFRTDNIDNNVTVRVDNLEVSVPEPTSIALLGAAMLAMGGLRRRRQK